MQKPRQVFPNAVFAYYEAGCIVKMCIRDSTITANSTVLFSMKLKSNLNAVSPSAAKLGRNEPEGSSEYTPASGFTAYPVSYTHLVAHRMPCQTQRQCGPLRGKQADAAAQDHRHDRELVNVDEVKRHHPAGELRAAAHPDIPPGARFQAAYRLCRVLGRKNGVCVRRGCTVCEPVSYTHLP